MSREIKFRVWETKNNKWISDNNLYSISHYYNIFTQDFDTWDSYYRGTINKKDLIIQQFTGLKDKHGKEVYEGDIIKFDIMGVVHGPEKENGIIGEVWYSEEDLQFVFGRYKTNDFLDYWFSMADRIDKKSIKILGNIFENKELLNG